MSARGRRLARAATQIGARVTIPSKTGYPCRMLLALVLSGQAGEPAEIQVDPYASLRADPALAPFAAEDPILAYLTEPAANASSNRAYEIIALSNLAEACVHRTAGAADEDPAWKLATTCVNRIVKVALDRFMSGDPESKPPSDALTMTHLIIVLASADHAQKSSAWDDANRDLLVRLSDRLKTRLLDDPDAIPASFSEDSRRWPADAAASIYALWLADHVAPAEDNEPRWKEAARRFVAWSSQRGIAGDWGLPVSEITGANAASAVPRGSALSWTIRYEASFDAAAAKRTYDRYKALYLVKTPIYGFREYPPAVNYAADADSGPIVNGIGASATAFAIGAAKATGDQEAFTQLRATEIAVAEIAAILPGGDVANDVLARAIAVNQALLVPWFKDGK